jgi:hypothetical protein
MKKMAKETRKKTECLKRNGERKSGSNNGEKWRYGAQLKAMESMKSVRKYGGERNEWRSAWRSA